MIAFATFTAIQTRPSSSMYLIMNDLHELRNRVTVIAIYEGWVKSLELTDSPDGGT